MSTWTGRLKSKMKELGLTQEELARKLGVTRSAVAHYVQGTRHPPVRQIIKLASILKTEPSWLQFGKGEDSISTVQISKHSSKKIPILDWNQVLHFDASNKSNENFLEYFNSDNIVCYALQIKGDSMVSPMGQGISFNQGSYIVIDPNQNPTHGSFVIAMSSNKKEAVLRQYILEGGTTYLKPLNPQYPLMQFERSTKILGVVVANINLV